MRRSLVLDESRPVWRTMLIFLGPLVASNIVNSLNQTLYSIYLGRLMGPKALAAAGSIFPIIFLLISFLFGLASAASILIGQAYGAGDRSRVKAIVGATLGSCIGLLAVLGGLCSWAAPSLMHAIGTPSDIFDLATTYARAVFALMPITFTFFIYATFMRGIGDSRTPFIAFSLSALLNAGLIPWGILGGLGVPAMGIVGAAFGGGVANLLSIVALIVYLNYRRSAVAFDGEVMRHLWPRRAIVANIIRVGVPSGFQMIMLSLSEIAVITFVNHFGSSATAAYAAVNQIVNYVQFPAMSIGIAASIFGAQAIGAGKIDRLRQIVHSSVALNYALELAILIVCYVFANGILSLFITDDSVRRIARELLNITLWSYAIYGNAFVISGIVRSSGDVLWPMAISICSIWLVEVPTAWALMHRIGLPGVWFGYPAGYISNLIAQYAYYRFVWKRKPIVAIRYGDEKKPVMVAEETA